ncbi:hypothetical protein [Salana multivorans]
MHEQLVAFEESREQQLVPLLVGHIAHEQREIGVTRPDVVTELARLGAQGEAQLVLRVGQELRTVRLVDGKGA